MIGAFGMAHLAGEASRIGPSEHVLSTDGPVWSACLCGRIRIFFLITMRNPVSLRRGVVATLESPSLLCY